MIKHISKGIEARRQHDPIELAKDYDRVAHELVSVRGMQRQASEFDRAPPPERQTVLEDEISLTIENAGSDVAKAARRILLVPRIAKALRLLEDHENGLVDLVYPGTRKD